VYTVLGEIVIPDEESNIPTIILNPAYDDGQPGEEAEQSESWDSQWQAYPASRRRFAPVGWALVGAALVLTGVLVVALVVPWWETSATVTIVPLTQPISTTLTAHLVPGNANPARQQVQGRPLVSMTMNQSKTADATGSGYQAAQAAQGWISLYNALPTPQTVPGGTLLIGQDGVQFTTDSTVTIPAANLPVDGQISVSAHASEPGPAGNIASLDINGPCCRSDVLAKNAAPFIGGQNARSYQAVSAQDIQGTSTTLEMALTQDVTAAYQAELGDGERLLTPVACTTQVKADHPTGSEAAQVSVTVSEACQGTAYSAAQMQTLVVQAMHQHMQGNQAGAYHLDTNVLHIQVTSDSTQAGDVQVQARGTLLYQWSQPQQRALSILVAGKSEAQATTLLEQQPGISTVAITVTGRDTDMLPTDPGRIQFVFVTYSR